LRIPRALAWLLIAMAVFTAGLLRQFHDLTPTSPFLAPAVGSLLFACVVFLFLVAARERQIGAAPGPGIRLGSVTPILLMLLVEKWVSSSFYQPFFVLASPPDLADDTADAWFRLLCGVGLLVIVACAIAGLSGCLALVAFAAGSTIGVILPRTPGPLAVVLFGQAAIALGEETYYRGLLLGEFLRLTPRLGLQSPSARRWGAVMLSSILFGMEHVGNSSGWTDGARQLIFALALGTLLGLLVLVTDNLWFAASLHAWINWLLLGAAPRLGYGPAHASLPAGASVSLTLIAAFLAAFAFQRRATPR
jgi:membrane protease YdiL (CAAX protease family)